MSTNGTVSLADQSTRSSVGKRCGPGATAINCCVQGCGSIYGDIGVSFHRFPMINTAQDVLRRELWVEAAGLTNQSQTKVDSSLICGRHFEKGKPSLPNEIKAVNWAPSLFLKRGGTGGSMGNASGASGTAETPTMKVANTVTPQPREVLPILPIMGPQCVPKDANLPEFCRLCLAEGVQMVFPKDSRVYDYLATKISDHLRLTITVAELTRSLICKKCYETLEQFHQFRARCVRQDTYLNMRRCLEPDRKHPLRYKDNWYWYSCLGNNMNSVIWGCSVICCPAFIVSHPSGRICSKYANHQHKQKMDDVKSVYCNGEYVFDGYRYSFEMINLNRTLTFSCRSLKDPHNECAAILVSNDRSEVLSVGVHNHEREIIIESAIKDAVDGAKRSITLIRGFDQEIVFCQGYWYSTISEQSSVSHWNCIRGDCTSTITMVNGMVQYFGTHCHLPVFLKWGAEEDRTVEPKNTSVMKVVNPVAPKPTVTVAPVATVQTMPPVVCRESTTIVHSRPPGVTAPNAITGNDSPALMEIKTEPTELQITSVRSYAPPEPVRSQPNKPLVVSAAPNITKLALPLSSSNLPTVAVRSNHHIQVVRQTSGPTVRVFPPARPKLIPSIHPPRIPAVVPVRLPTPQTTVLAPPPQIPKILHVMSLNRNQPPAIQPEPETPPATTATPILDVPVPEPLPKSEWDEMTPTIKQEPDPEPPEDEPETITDEIQPTATFIAATTTAVEPPRIISSLPKPPPLMPRPMLLVSSASVVSNNTLDVTALDSDSGIESLASMPRKSPGISTVTSSVESSKGRPPPLPVEEDEDGLLDLQDDEDIPPIVPIDADVVSRIIGNEYTTRVLPNGKTQVIRKTILSRSANTPPATTTTQPLSGSNGSKVMPIKVYGSPASAPKRISDGGELDNTLTKKAKTSESSDPLESVDVEKSPEPDDEVLEEESSAEDPIAVSTEPHQNISDDEPVQEGDSSNEEQPSRPATPPQVDEPKTQEAPAPTEQPDVAAAGQPDKKKSVQLVKLQRTEQMLSHEGHLYKLKWHNRRRNYWDCMLRDQVNCMAILETVGEHSRNWRKFGSHNHKIPKPIINDDNRSSYRMLTNETSVANVKQLPVQTMSIDDIEEGSGRMMSLSKRKLFGYRIRKYKQCLVLYFASYEYRIKNAVFPGFRWKCASCSCTVETDEKFTICQELGVTHNHDPQVADVIDLVEDGSAATVEGPKSKPLEAPQQTKPPETTATAEDDSVEQNQELERVDLVEDDSPKEVEATSREAPAEEDCLSDHNLQAVNEEESPAIESTPQQAEVQSEEVDPIDAMLQEITGEQGQDDRGGNLDPSTGDLCRKDSGGQDDYDDEEMILDPSTGDMVNMGELKRKEKRKALLEDIIADEDDDEAEYLDPLTGEMRRKGDQSSFAAEPLPEENSPDQNVSDVGPSKDPEVSQEDFEDLLKKDSTKESTDTRKLKRPKKNSLAALKLVVDLHKRLKIPVAERNFEVLPAPEDSSACLIRFNEFTFELDSIHDTISVWKCHLSPQYACRGKVHLSKDFLQVTATGVSHCHASTLVDMFTELSSEQNGQIMDTDRGSTREYTFYKRSDYVYQLRLDDGYLYNCLTISKTGVSCWRCADRQAHNCKAMFTMEGSFKSLVRNRFNHPHDPVSPEGVEFEADGGGDGQRSMDLEGKRDSPVATKRPAKSENEDDRKKQKRQTL